MEIVIRNERLTVVISALGAELQSIKDSDGTEYLWDGNRSYWENRAPDIFPYIGRLTQETYRLDGKYYHMGIHGFAAGKQFVVHRIEESAVAFELIDDESTRVMYPFRFVLGIEYRLENACLNVTYTVENKGQRTLYFGIGGHPGFALPFEKGLQFEDYYLKFDEAAALVRVGFSDTCFRTGEAKPFSLNNGRLYLEHRMFDQDAIVLESAARSVVLMSDKGTKGIRVTFPVMPYIGLWHRPRTTAPYICIEPWSSLPSHDGIVEDISQQEDLIRLPAEETYCNSWSIDIIDNIGEKQ